MVPAKLTSVILVSLAPETRMPVWQSEMSRSLMLAWSPFTWMAAFFPSFPTMHRPLRFTQSALMVIIAVPPLARRVVFSVPLPMMLRLL